MSFLIRHIAGNTSGRDHIFWPTILRTEALAFFGGTPDDQQRSVDYTWPVAVNLDVMMQMCWRVREWRLNASSFSYVGAFSGGDYWSMDANLPEMILKMRRVKSPAVPPPNSLREVTDEQDILGPASDVGINPNSLSNAGTLCGNGDDIPYGGADSVSDDITLDYELFDVPLPYPEISETKDYGTLLCGGYVIFDPSTGNFLPQFFIRGEFRKNYLVQAIYGDPIVRFKTLSPTPNAPPAPYVGFGNSFDVPQGTLTIINPVIGQPNITLPMGIIGDQPFFGTEGGAGSVNLTMTPIRWWPYENGAGDPVWDETTGAQVGDPFG